MFNDIPIKKWGERNAPCKGCPERWVKIENGVAKTCHAKCGKYAEFKSKTDAERESRKECLQQNDAIADLHRKRGKRR